METKKLSWKPIRNGPLYCSPACGGRCTWGDYQKAKKDAKALADKLSNSTIPGWRFRVWENLGWHHCVISPCGRINIHDNIAFLGPKWGSGGLWAERGKTPLLAIRAVVYEARKDLARIDAILTNLDWVK